MAMNSGITSLVAELIADISKSAFLSWVYICVPWVCSISIVCGIVHGLFRLHRSKSFINKTIKDYSFLKRLLLRPAWEQCLHARKFCRIMICYFYFRSILFIVSAIFAAYALSNPSCIKIEAYFILIVFCTLDIPAIVLHFTLSEHPFKRMETGYRFDKYNRTRERNKLF